MIQIGTVLQFLGYATVKCVCEMWKVDSRGTAQNVLQWPGVKCGCADLPRVRTPGHVPKKPGGFFG